MNAIILSIGDELVTGQTVDTNSAYLSQKLAEHGIAATMHVTVGDEQSAIADAIRSTCQTAELVIITGGLGPTEDDVTRQAVASVMGSELRIDDQRLAEIQAFFDRIGRPMHETNRIQAMIPVGAESLVNPVGTAPGIAAKVAKAMVFIMPGVPAEMKKMFDLHVVPRLPAASGVSIFRLIHTFGLGESDIASKIADLMQRGRNPLIGTTVANGLVSVRVICTAAAQSLAEKMSNDAIAELRQRLGTLVVAEGQQSMPDAIGQLLLAGKWTLATAESCTAGMIGQMITSISGASEYYLGGMITYSNDAKSQLLDVPAEMLKTYGAVSEQVASAMAQGCRKKFSSDWGMSITGIAGPTGGSKEKPVGLVYIGIACPDGSCQVHRHIYPGARDTIRLRSSLGAMNLLRLKLIETAGK